jgi:hypothetical protein
MAARVKKVAIPVDVAPINIKSSFMRIEGTSPLIVHKFSEKAKKELLDKATQKAKSGREPKNPVGEFMESLHWITPMPAEYTEEAFAAALKAGAKFGFPATGLKKSAVSGAYRAGLTKDKVSTFGAFHIGGGELVEIQGTPRMREDYAIVSNGSPDIRFRAEFPVWSMEFEIFYNASVYSLDQLITFFGFGGFATGVGDWRIERGGIFGGYRVV